MKETEWWWIDFLENDLDAGMCADIEFLLEHSESDQEEFERWRALKAWVKEADPAHPMERLWRAEDLRDQKNKILEAVKNLPVEGADQGQQVTLRLL